MRILASLVVLTAAASPALADFGVRPTRTDFQSAVSTQYARPDGGRRYYPPNTATLLQVPPPMRDDAVPAVKPVSNPPPPSPATTPPAATPPLPPPPPPGLPALRPNARTPVPGPTR